MPSFPRYTTYRPDELEKALRERLPEGALLPTTPTKGGRLLKECSFTVSFPDGQIGTCAYERLGPVCHRFRYRCHDGDAMPRQYFLRPLQNTMDAIAAKGQELADSCYREAIERERREYFCRASEPSDGSRKKRPERYQMRSDRAKELAGRYALCRRLGDSLLPVSESFAELEAVNAAWRERGDQSLVVACCCRLDRCWELLKYNPLVAEGHPRREADHVP